MKQRALVMGGGGMEGIAWETGLAAGLMEQGVNLGAADLIVGTSAGSVVGAQLAAGYDPRIILELYKGLLSSAPRPDRSQLDADALAQVFTVWAGAGEMSPAVRRELGALALRARTAPEEQYIGSIAQVLGVQEWPDRRFLATAVEVGTGDFVVWDRGGGAPIERAVASSCCVPGVFPPVTIGGKRYVDGGVRSSTNADLAQGSAVVVIVAPLAERQFEHGRRTLDGEIASLRADGSTVELIAPDAASLGVFGPDMMDPARLVPAAQAGFRQGQEIAERLQQIWG